MSAHIPLHLYISTPHSRLAPSTKLPSPYLPTSSRISPHQVGPEYQAALPPPGAPSAERGDLPLRLAPGADSGEEALAVEVEVSLEPSLKGVRRAPSGRFEASRRMGGRKVHLGTFDTQAEAAAAYARAAPAAPPPLGNATGGGRHQLLSARPCGTPGCELRIGHLGPCSCEAAAPRGRSSRGGRSRGGEEERGEEVIEVSDDE